ncbi:lytic transglycosylase domain-containing protein [Methylovirgula sp. 4M-Z18]|uniref:lytic transglycosylase domain-containing protein n=1 Tax=Methylovirgula sp. 4M-Z18 TaxID=2293567 RepID=UPI0024789644|nr:lytic transglycosylase domain-containing protein [Methylovirgula sp. 4M-Z18]
MVTLPPAVPASCYASVPQSTLAAIVRVESSGNPFSIGVVGGHLVRQPRSREEAVATAIALRNQGFNFSMGLGQVNLHNLSRYNMSYATAFEPCANLRAAADILADCYQRAKTVYADPFWPAVSCYYSGNFTRGFVADYNHTSYVQRVAQAADLNAVAPIAVVRDPGLSQQDAPKAPKENVAVTPSKPHPAAPVVLFSDDEPTEQQSAAVVFPESGKFTRPNRSDLDDQSGEIVAQQRKTTN